MPPSWGPAVPRRRLGAELRSLREGAGFLIEQVAQELECSTSKISRLETGKGIPRARDVRDMLTIYGVVDARVRDRLLRWARDGQQQGWWHDFSGILAEKEEAFVALEADAASMRSYDTTVVHGLLQTEAYAREIATGIRVGPELVDMEMFVQLRRHRQEVLRRDKGPLDLHVIMEEAALYRPVGGVTVLREQLTYLLDVAGYPNIILQVLPLATGVHPALTGSFALLAFDDVDDGVVFAEGVAGGAILENARDVEAYALVFEEIRRRALSPEDSVTFIASILQGSD